MMPVGALCAHCEGDSLERMSHDEVVEGATSGAEKVVEDNVQVADDVDSTDDVKLKEHDLKRSWTLWFDTPKADSKPNWFDNVSNVFSFSTVENFWRLYNNIESPTYLKPKSNYYLFQKDIPPMWEHAANGKGGKWVIEVSPHQSDSCWLNLVLSLIGDSIEGADDITGIIIGIKSKKHKISIWTKDANNEESCIAIGKSIKEILKLNNTLYYLPHDTYVHRSRNIKGNDKAMYSC